MSFQRTKKTNLNCFIYGESQNPSEDFKTVLFVQIVPQRSIFVVVFGAFMAYIGLIICGTMGSPNPIKINQLECGIHNNCTIAKSHGSGRYLEEFQSHNFKFLNQHYQVCEKNNMWQKQHIITSPYDFRSKMLMKLYVPKSYLDKIGDKDKKIILKLNYGIYASNDNRFYQSCQKYNYAPEPKITEIDENTNKTFKFITQEFQIKQETAFQCEQYTPQFWSKDYLKHSDSSPSEKSLNGNKMQFEDFQYGRNQTEDQFVCSAEIASQSMKEEMYYRMMVVDFLDEEIDYRQIMNTAAVQREPNFVLFKYKKTMSFIFFLTSVINLFLYALKLYRLKWNEMGFLKLVLYANLICLVIYNLIYCFQLIDNWFGRFTDSFFNSLMYTLVLLLNLVIMDSQTEKMNTNLSKQDSKGNRTIESASKQINAFLLPKVLVCITIFIILYFLMNTHSFRMLNYVTQMNQLNDSIDTKQVVGSYDITDIICFIVFGVYACLSTKIAFEAFTHANTQYKSSRTSRNYNLHSLIFEDGDFELVTDLSISRYSSVLTCMVSMVLLALLFMPPRDEMLQFMDESGLINLYLIVVSFLLSPVLEEDVIRYEAEIAALKLQGQLYQSQLKALTSSRNSMTGSRQNETIVRHEGRNHNQFLKNMKHQNELIYSKVNQKMQEREKKLKESQKIKDRRKSKQRNIVVYEEEEEAGAPLSPMQQLEPFEQASDPTSQVELQDINLDQMDEVKSEEFSYDSDNQAAENHHDGSLESDDDEQQQVVDLVDVHATIEDNGMEVKVETFI